MERSTGIAARASTRRASSPRSSIHVRGGFYRLAPADHGWTSKQLYFPDTNVLFTRFLTPDGVGEIEDFMADRAQERWAWPATGAPCRSGAW